MTLTNVKIGDVVLCDVRGNRFHALVEDKLQRGLKVKPFSKSVTWREVTSNQVCSHWRKSKMSNC